MNEEDQNINPSVHEETEAPIEEPARVLSGQETVPQTTETGIPDSESTRILIENALRKWNVKEHINIANIEDVLGRLEEKANQIEGLQGKMNAYLELSQLARALDYKDFARDCLAYADRLHDENEHIMKEQDQSKIRQIVDFLTGRNTIATLAQDK